LKYLAISDISPRMLFKSIFNNRALVLELIKRDVVGRYKGSILGLLWSFFSPVLMLTIYTFVFSFVFKTRWVGGGDSKVEFALVLFVGLMVFNFFSECINRAPFLVVSNINYVKKIIFPLEILPLVIAGSAAFHFLVSMLVWLGFYLFFFGFPPIEIIYLPLILLPLVFFTLGVSWVLSSLSVYIRDTSQFVGVIVTALMFLSPIFYPLASLPKNYQFIMRINPITGIVEQARSVMMFGGGVSWSSLLIHMMASMIVAWAGFAWFQKTRKGFADVL